MPKEGSLAGGSLSYLCSFFYVSYMNILLIDDELDILELLEEELSELGHTVSTCSNPSEIVNYISEIKKVDVVICDNRMPDMDGFSVLAYLKDKLKPFPKFFLLTGSLEITNEDVLKNGGNGIIRKPFSVDEVNELISS